MIIEARVDRPAAGGEFIALYDGRIVLIKGGIPGETVRIRIANPDAKLWRGDVVEVLEASAGRVEQPCAAAKAGAGCCDWGFISPVFASDIKGEIVLDCLRRLGRFDSDSLPEIAVRALAPAEHWRTRVRLGVDHLGRAGIRKAASRELVIGRDCAQADERLLEGLDRPGSVLLEQPAGKSRRRHKLGELHVAIDTEGHRSAVHVQGNGRHRRQRVIEGGASLKENIHGITFDIPTTGFWQAHRAAPAYYTDRVAELLAPFEPKIGWDLYGGSGVLAAGLLTAMGYPENSEVSVVSVENYAASSAAGRKAFAGYPVEFVTGEVADAARKLAAEAKAEHRSVDVVVLDPPRSGAGKEAVAAIASASPKAVVHIGCDPATFARDARFWADAGYRMTRLEAVDAFPLTHHVETISLWQRKV